jgi:hypothetical protein
MDPELLLAPNGEPAAPKPEAPEAPQVLEVDPDAPLTLADTAEVEKMLSAEAPTPTPAAPKPAASAARASDELLKLTPDRPASASARPAAPASLTPVSASDAKATSAAPAAAPAPDTPAFVPLARRASLSAAAKKLAAVSAAPAAPPAKPPTPVKPTAAAASVATLKPHAVPAGTAAAPAAKAPPSAAPRPESVPVVSAASPAAPTATPAADAPSLASWANARAAAAASAKSAPASARASAPAAKPAQPATTDTVRAAAPAAPPAAAPPATAPAVVTPSRGMDRDFIARNQVVERYLSGKLPIKAATDFERYCNEHPELLDELGLPERVNAGLRLLEASGKPEPWQEAARPLWQQPVVTLGLAGFAALLAVSLAIVAFSSAGKTHKILDLQTQVAERTLDPAASTRVIRLLPNRSGATNSPAITIGGGREAQLADLRIDETRSPYRDFRVTIDRIDQGRVMVIDNLTKDSNGHLRLAINSSALGPGNYLLTIEGLTTRLEPQPDSWVTIGVAQH